MRSPLSAFFALGPHVSPLFLQLVPLASCFFIGPEDEERGVLAGAEIWGMAWKPPLSQKAWRAWGSQSKDLFNRVSLRCSAPCICFSVSMETVAAGGKEVEQDPLS